jgi:hypothetical protein
MHKLLAFSCSGDVNISRHSITHILVFAQSVNIVLRCVCKAEKRQKTLYGSDVRCVPLWPCSGLLTSVNALEGSCA